MIDDDEKTFFREEGYLLLKGFYDYEPDILPIQRAIHGVVGRVADRHGVSIDRQPFAPETFDAGYNDLLAAGRQYAAETYDLVKQIPAFLRLISNQRADDLFCLLRDTDLSGIGAASYGIRIDNPNEDKFRSHWHQEFVFQPQSIDGIVFWTPLVPVTADLGPVVVLPKSHKDGLCTYAKAAAYADKQGAYQIGIHDEKQVIARYDQVAPLTEPGDLLLMDFLTIHGSGVNRAARSRWSIQNRFFNFNDDVGRRIGWKPSITTGVRVEELFPDNFVEV